MGKTNVGVGKSGSSTATSTINERQSIPELGSGETTYYWITYVLGGMLHGEASDRKTLASINTDFWKVVDAVEEWIDKWRDYGDTEGYLAFKRYWKWFRLVISLQLRLLVEQRLYDLGPPWSYLCTGFQPVGYRRS